MADAFGLVGVREAFRKDFIASNTNSTPLKATLAFTEPFPLDLVTPSLRAAMLALVHDENWSEADAMFERAWGWSHILVIVVDVSTEQLVFFRLQSDVFDFPTDGEGTLTAFIYLLIYKSDYWERRT